MPSPESKNQQSSACARSGHDPRGKEGGQVGSSAAQAQWSRRGLYRHYGGPGPLPLPSDMTPGPTRVPRDRKAITGRATCLQQEQRDTWIISCKDSPPGEALPGCQLAPLGERNKQCQATPSSSSLNTLHGKKLLRGVLIPAAAPQLPILYPFFGLLAWVFGWYFCFALFCIMATPSNAHGLLLVLVRKHSWQGQGAPWCRGSNPIDQVQDKCLSALPAALSPAPVLYSFDSHFLSLT